MIGCAAFTGLLPLYASLAARLSPAFGALSGGLNLLTWLCLLTRACWSVPRSTPYAEQP